MSTLVEIHPIQDAIVLRRSPSELLILAHHVTELKGKKTAKEFAEYFMGEALVNRPARKLFENWLRKDGELWRRLYQSVQAIEQNLGDDDAPSKKVEPKSADVKSGKVQAKKLDADAKDKTPSKDAKSDVKKASVKADAKSTAAKEDDQSEKKDSKKAAPAKKQAAVAAKAPVKKPAPAAKRVSAAPKKSSAPAKKVAPARRSATKSSKKS
jgi:hypothetical protein